MNEDQKHQVFTALVLKVRQRCQERDSYKEEWDNRGSIRFGIAPKKITEETARARFGGGRI